MLNINDLLKRDTPEPYQIRRYRNVVSAIENLITQLDAWESHEPFAIELKLAHRLYKMELEWHRRQHR